MTTATIPLKPSDVEPREGESALAHGDVPVNLSLSAYDVPRAVEIAGDDRRAALRIQFQYVDKEADDRRQADDVVLYLGEKSGKLLALEVKWGGAPADELTSRLIQAVEKQIETAGRDNQRLNYKLVIRLIPMVLKHAFQHIK